MGSFASRGGQGGRSRPAAVQHRFCRAASGDVEGSGQTSFARYALSRHAADERRLFSGMDQPFGWSILRRCLLQPLPDRFRTLQAQRVAGRPGADYGVHCRARYARLIWNHRQPRSGAGSPKSRPWRQLESAFFHPQIVGIHHFNFKDQVLTARWDGENYGFGLVDITDTPYQDFLDLNRQASEQLYEFRTGTGKQLELP